MGQTTEMEWQLIYALVLQKLGTKLFFVIKQKRTFIFVTQFNRNKFNE